MTYYGPKELAASFRTVRHNTIQIAEDIPEAQYGYRASPDSRSVAETLVHIAVGTRFPEQIHIVEHRSAMEGFDFAGFLGQIAVEEKVARSKDEILELLRGEGERFAGVLEGLSEDLLAESVRLAPGMVPPTKSRFEMLLGPKEHEMHHRAQLMVVERMLGITPHLTRQLQERMAKMQAAKAAA
jgi:uncharacterized damage-inducible protein DinB